MILFCYHGRRMQVNMEMSHSGWVIPTQCNSYPLRQPPCHMPAASSRACSASHIGVTVGFCVCRTLPICSPRATSLADLSFLALSWKSQDSTRELSGIFALFPQSHPTHGRRTLMWVSEISPGQKSVKFSCTQGPRARVSVHTLTWVFCLSQYLGHAWPKPPPHQVAGISNAFPPVFVQDMWAATLHHA